MSELISGKEALQDIENSQISYNTGKWFPLINCEFKIHEILDGRSDTGNSLKFRLKPRTITINGIEVPAPFKPKNGEMFFYLNGYSPNGFGCQYKTEGHSNYTQFGAWRTEEEIKQVVEAQRIVFKPQ